MPRIMCLESAGPLGPNTAQWLSNSFLSSTWNLTRACHRAGSSKICSSFNKYMQKCISEKVTENLQNVNPLHIFCYLISNNNKQFIIGRFWQRQIVSEMRRGGKHIFTWGGRDGAFTAHISPKFCSLWWMCQPPHKTFHVWPQSKLMSPFKVSHSLLPQMPSDTNIPKQKQYQVNL